MCSYCGCREIPIIAQLNAEHDAIVNSTYALQVAHRDHDLDATRAAGRVLAALLHPHTEREQDGLFAEMRKDKLFTEHIASLCAEHHELDELLAGVELGDLSLVPGMLTLLHNHIDREENGLFPAALAYLDDDQWDVIQRAEPMPGTAAEQHDHQPAVPHTHPH
ncbi:hemerythrin domain-containing protein [Nakamurella sp. GG22]